VGHSARRFIRLACEWHHHQSLSHLDAQAPHLAQILEEFANPGIPGTLSLQKCVI
jgi:hypothetical protein